MQRLLFKWTGYDRVQRLIESEPNQDGLTFISRATKEFGVHYRIHGKIEKEVRSTVFVCTHHTGAIDFLVVYPIVKKISPHLKVIANQQLIKLKPLREDLLLVHPLSANKSNAEAKKQIANHLKHGGNILVYPAGKVGRKINGVVEDFEWRTGLFPLLQNESQQVIPIFVHAQNSDFFYFIRRFFPKLSLLFILRSLAQRDGKEIQVHLGPAIKSKDLQGFSSKEGMDIIRNKTYELRNAQEIKNANESAR